MIIVPNNNAQLVLATNPLWTNEVEFKKYFTISTDMHAATNQQHIIIGSKLLSKRTLKEIKFNKNNLQFLAWLAKEKILIKSNLLGFHKTMTIGYLTKLHLQLANCTTHKTLLQLALEDVTIDETLAIDLNPTLKETQTRGQQ